MNELVFLLFVLGVVAVSVVSVLVYLRLISSGSSWTRDWR